MSRRRADETRAKSGESSRSSRGAKHDSSLAALQKFLVVGLITAYDDRGELAPEQGRKPKPLLLLHMERGKVVRRVELDEVPGWAKPILAAALGAA
jgi:hypothetical protein